MPKGRSSSLAEAQADLIGVCGELRDEIEVLRMAIDELREEIQTAVRNVYSTPLPARRITSMPSDPCADDFAARVNRVDPAQRDEWASQAESLPAPLPPVTASSNAKQSAADPLSTPSTTVPAGPVSAEPIRTVNSSTAIETAARKKPPLYLRIVNRVPTGVVRAIGYETISLDELRRRLEPLANQHGQAVVEETAGELVERVPASTNLCRLSFEARQAARWLLGPPPDEPACGISTISQSPPKRGSHEPESSAADRAESHPRRPVKHSRQIIMARFAEHCENTEQAITEMNADQLAPLRHRGLMCPDFITTDGPPDELIAIRRSLSKTQRHDMGQWIDIFGRDYDAVRIWPEASEDRLGEWVWHVEIVATPEYEETGADEDDFPQGEASPPQGE
jgi:hypothetical protein